MNWAGERNAVEVAYPPLLPASLLHRTGYFRSFPHLATFAVTLDEDETNVREFTAGESVDDTGAVRLTRTAPVRAVLTPAACYHVYPEFEGAALDGLSAVTTRAVCFRREATFRPLERQWSFSMREIVGLGSPEEVTGFLDHYRGRIEAFFRAVDLPVAWMTATDPFFDPGTHPKHLMQRLDPVKTEMVFADRLAIGSINLHRSFFAETYGIRRREAPAWSGCVAFGVERWLHAWFTRFGHDPAGWPPLG